MKPLKCSDCYCQVKGEKCQFGYEGEPHITSFGHPDGQQSTADCPACKTLEQFEELINKSPKTYDVHQCDGIHMCNGIVYVLAMFDSCNGCWALRQSWCTLGYDNQCRHKAGTLLIPLEACPKPLDEEEFFIFKYIKENL